MPTTTDFLTASQWAGIVALLCVGLAVLGFVFKWGLRFRLVGVTGFMGVLTTGLFALSLVPITRTVVPGAVRFLTVYDAGAAQVVITVPPTISEPELEATLRQAASDRFSLGRLSQGTEQLTIRARVITHPEEGVSQPLYLGQIKRSLLVRDDDQMEVTLNRNDLAQLPRLTKERES